MVTGHEPQQVTDQLKIIQFNRHFFKLGNQKAVAKGNYWILKKAFAAALTP